MTTGHGPPGLLAKVDFLHGTAVSRPLANPLAKALGKLLACLEHEGEESRVVGGAVRNALLGLPAHDVDVATTMLPEAVMRQAAEAGFHPVPTGIEHGTITVVVSGIPFEVTTLRQDIDTDGRHAVVRFGQDFALDALRRDFTINALSVDRAGTVFDYTGGIADLVQRKIRFIGDPSRRIAEDYLRILRFFRFHAQYGRGALDEAGLAACLAAKDGLGHLSRERIRQEVLKLLAAEGAVPVVYAMLEGGLGHAVFGAGTRFDVFRRLAGAEAALGLDPAPMLRLCALVEMRAGDVPHLQERLRLSNAEADSLRLLAADDPRVHPRLSQHQKLQALYGLARVAGEDARALYVGRALLEWADGGTENAPGEGLRELVRGASDMEAPVFPVGGNELRAAGVPQGPMIGLALGRIEAAWIKAGFPQDRAALDRLVSHVVEALPEHR